MTIKTNKNQSQEKGIFSTEDLEKEIFPKIKRGHHIVWFNTNKDMFQKTIKLTSQRLKAEVEKSFERLKELVKDSEQKASNKMLYAWEVNADIDIEKKRLGI